MRIAFIPFLVSVLPGIAAATEPTVKIADMTSWSIVCSGAATECEEYAAKEFQTLFHGLTGKELPITEKAPGSKGAIFIGPDAVASSGQPVPTAPLGEEGLRIDVGEEIVSIHGGRPRGTLYGIYEFFEEL